MPRHAARVEAFIFPLSTRGEMSLFNDESTVPSTSCRL